LHIPLWGEFRAWVYDNQLTAISQYYTSFHWPELDGDTFQLSTPKGQIFHKLAKLFEQVRDRFSDLGNYIIDFAITGDGRAIVLELNPYLPSTGACLFTWEADSQVCCIWLSP